MSRKTCVCGEPARRQVLSGGGEVLAIFCSLCTRPIVVKCPACKKDDLKDLAAHFRVKPDCFKKADPNGFAEWSDTVTGRAALDKINSSLTKPEQKRIIEP